MAERILDACSTYILHTCIDLFPVSKCARKHLNFDVTWSKSDEEGAIQRRTIRPVWDWKISEDRIRQQENGQAYWCYRGKVQQVQTARVSLSPEQISEGWKEIQRQEAMQRMQLDLEAKRRQEQQEQKSPKQSPSPSPSTASATAATQKKEAKPEASTKKAPTKKTAPDPGVPNTSAPEGSSEPEPVQKPASALPISDPDDDEPDRL